jgi:hypothetical protein
MEGTAVPGHGRAKPPVFHPSGEDGLDHRGALQSPQILRQIIAFLMGVPVGMLYAGVGDDASATPVILVTGAQIHAAGSHIC